MSRIHICLVSDQPIPNLIPLKMEELKPDTALLLVSPDMKMQAERLEKIIATLGINVTKHGVEPYNLASARDTFMNILAELENHETTLNVTGGTKIMAFAAFEVFREMGKPIIYVDTQNNRIQILSPEAKNVQFKGVIKVKSYLAAYGQYIEEDHTDYEKIHVHKSAFASLINGMEKFVNPIGIMNGYAAPLRNARSFPLQIRVEDHHLSLPEFREVLALFEEHGIIKKKEGKIEFPSLSDVEFVSGGWLEEYVFDVVSSLPVTDLRMGIKVKWDQTRNAPVNEYDVLFTHENRLYLVECKTKRFLGADRKETNDELIYKLENLRDAAGGLYGKGMLVSYRRLADEQKRRLHANRLEYCDAANLKNIKEKIKSWMK